MGSHKNLTPNPSPTRRGEKKGWKFFRDNRFREIGFVLLFSQNTNGFVLPSAEAERGIQSLIRGALIEDNENSFRVYIGRLDPSFRWENGARPPLYVFIFQQITAKWVRFVTFIFGIEDEGKWVRFVIFNIFFFGWFFLVKIDRHPSTGS